MTATVRAGAYVFGIVPAGAELPDVDGSGPANGLRLVESGEFAAVVGTPPADRSLGRAADLMAHDEVLGALVDAGTPVLPMRFGTLVRDDEAVLDDVLTPLSGTLRADLDRVAGRVQYRLRVTYEQDVVLREVLAARPDIAELRTSGAAESFDGRIRLGELVVQALDRLRPSDAQAVLDDLEGVADSRLDRTTAAEDVLSAALLVAHDRVAEFERSAEAAAERHHPRLRMRLVGPSAPYDFVGAR